MRCDVRARRVREEVTAFRPERIDGPDDLQNWQRLRNVLLEALRLYPPIPTLISGRQWTRRNLRRKNWR